MSQPVNHGLDMLKIDKIRMLAEEGHDINYNDALYLVRAISKLLHPPRQYWQTAEWDRFVASLRGPA